MNTNLRHKEIDMALTGKIEIPRRTMALFFVIDTSGSMDGSKIGAVNTSVEEVIPAIKEVPNVNANKDVLKEFTGSMEAVLEVHNTAMRKKMIKFVSVRASQVASKSANIGNSGDGEDEQKQQELNANLQEFQEEEIAAAPDNDQDDW